MIDKVQKIRKEVKRIQLYTQSEVLKQVLDYIDEVQKEPVSEDLEQAIEQSFIYHENHGDDFRCDEQIETSYRYGFETGANWQKEQFEKERLKHCDALTAEQAQMESYFVVNHLKKNNRTPTFIDAIEYGMRLQKEQMMEKAIDGYVIEDIEEGNGDFLLSADYLPKSMGLKDRQKVKVIVIIKED